jgi:hypothetical protein
MHAMAKLLSEHAGLESGVEALRREVAEKEERCVQLRQVIFQPKCWTEKTKWAFRCH